MRPAQESDAEAAVEVIRQSILESCTDDHRGDADTIAKWLANKTVEHFLSWLANSDNYCVIAEVNDRLVRKVTESDACRQPLATMAVTGIAGA